MYLWAVFSFYVQHMWTCFLINNSRKWSNLNFDFSYRSSGGQEQGLATLNINNWLKFFNVRSNPIDLVAGTAYDIKLVPFQHTATPAVKDMYWKDRKCLFQDEQAWGIITLTWLVFYWAKTTKILERRQHAQDIFAQGLSVWVQAQEHLSISRMYSMGLSHTTLIGRGAKHPHVQFQI